MADTLNPGESLGINQQLQSNNGRYVLIMQADGNLVEYRGIPSLASAVWATNTWGLEPAFQPVRADMQQDGNFVLYSAINNPVWATGTHGNPGSRLVLQDDAHLVIYAPDGRPLWGSGFWEPIPRPTEPVRAFAPPSTNPRDFQDMGAFQWMRTEGTLYRDGRLMLSTATHNYNWGQALRAHAIAVGVDDAGRAIWVSQDFTCTTRCAVPDFSCASFGTELFTEGFEEVFGRYTARMDIYQGKVGSFVDLRDQTIRVIRGLIDVVEVAQELKDAIMRLFG